MSRRARATSLEILPEKIRDLSVVVLESKPPQFVIRGVRDMPTPGWKFRIDSVVVDVAGGHGHIHVKITDIAPTGNVIQVVTPTPIEIKLGSLPVGRHVVEISTRQQPRQRHQLLQAFAVEAKGGKPR